MVPLPPDRRRSRSTGCRLSPPSRPVFWPVRPHRAPKFKGPQKYNVYTKYNYIVGFILVVNWPNRKQTVPQIYHRRENVDPIRTRSVLSASPPSPLAGDRREWRHRPVATSAPATRFRPGDVAGIERRSALRLGVSLGALRSLGLAPCAQTARHLSSAGLHICTRFRPTSMTQCCFLITSSKCIY